MSYLPAFIPSVTFLVVAEFTPYPVGICDVPAGSTTVLGPQELSDEGPVAQGTRVGGGEHPGLGELRRAALTVVWLPRRTGG